MSVVTLITVRRDTRPDHEYVLYQEGRGATRGLQRQAHAVRLPSLSYSRCDLAGKIRQAWEERRGGKQAGSFRATGLERTATLLYDIGGRLCVAARKYADGDESAASSCHADPVQLTSLVQLIVSFGLGGGHVCWADTLRVVGFFLAVGMHIFLPRF